MKKSFLISSSGDRVLLFNLLIDSIEFYLIDDWNIYVNFLAWDNSDLENTILHIKLKCKNDFQYITTDKLTGCFYARRDILVNFQSDVWCIVDDDMIIELGKVKYNEAVLYLINNKEIGFLSCNYTNDMLKRTAYNSITTKLVGSTAGGLLFTDTIAKKVVNDIPLRNYRFQDVTWSLYAYSWGYSNVTYPDSLVIHNINSIGGRKTFEKNIDLDDYIRLTPSDFGGKYELYSLHNKNKKKLQEQNII